jgi:hypothetical protein
MAETATDAPGTSASSGGGKLGVWKKKYGPLPLWGWAIVLLVAILGYLYWKNKNSASSNSASNTTASDSTGAGQIPQFVNQTYTTVTPPAAPPTKGATTSNQIPGHQVITANGSETLEQIASKYGTTPADIVAFTKAHKPHMSAVETKFFSKPHGKVPKGIVLWVPESQVTNVTGPGPGGPNNG